MRILNVIDSMSPAYGGPVESVLKTSESLIALGHSVDVVCLDHKSSSWVISSALNIHALSGLTKNYRFSPKLNRWMRCNCSNYDVVILHSIWTYAVLGAWIELRSKGTPYYVFTHGMLDPWFGKIDPIKNLAKQIYWSLFLGPALAGAQAVLFTTEEERRLARTAFIGHAYKERIVAFGTADSPDGVSQQIMAFRNSVPKLGQKEFFLFLSRIHKKKGCDLLIDAFARIAKEYPHLDIVMAGPDQTGWRKTLKQRAYELGISDRVHWPGMLAGEAKWGAFRAAKAFILPSHQENFGIVVAEALACATPVLITNKVNIWREVEVGGGGFVESDTVEGVEQLMRRFLVLSKTDLEDMRLAARNTFIEKFNVNKAVRDLLAVFSGNKPIKMEKTSPAHDDAFLRGRSLRILRFIDSMNPAHGGPVEGIIRSSKVLKELGHSNEVVSLDRMKAPWISGSPVKIYPQGHIVKRYGFTVRLIPWVKAHIENYDVVIIHGIWTYATIGAWLALRKSKVPYFVFTHGMLDPWFGKTAPWKNAAKQIYWFLLLGPVLSGARAVLFTTEEERRLARTAFVGHAYNERVVAYGAADAPDDRRKQVAVFRTALPQLGERRFLLFLSRIHKKKGCDLLVEAFARIASTHSDLDLVIAGPDQTGWAKVLKTRAAQLGIAERIHWPGMLADDKKWGAFRAAEAFILPSHQENFGIVVAEALACSTPVLITDKVNIWQEIENGQCGLVASDTQEGIEALLRRFLALSPAGTTAMRVAARAVFLEKFHIDRAAIDLVATLLELI